MKTIHKKILPQYMDDVIRGRKTFEIRKDEDDIQVGDIIVLEKWFEGKYTNVSVNAEVTYVLRNCPEYGLMDGYCVIGIACNSNLIYNKGKADAIEELLKSICIGCGYLNGTKCENKLGCPCAISQAEVIRQANKVLNSLRGKQND